MKVSGGQNNFCWGGLARFKIHQASLIATVFTLPMMFLSLSPAHADGWLDSSQAPNEIRNNEFTDDRGVVGGIANTRHNLTMTYTSFQNRMDEFRNDYYQICVYCHTPHGANSTAAAPLWNRTVTSREYTLYKQDSTASIEPSGLDVKYSQPGPNSLTCLSCHDGATAIDSIINMPTQLAGEFRAGYKKSQENTTVIDQDFLDAWSGNKLGTGSPGDFATSGHAGFNSGGSSACMACHNAGPQAIGPDFGVFSIGDRFTTKDAEGVRPAINTQYLADDHPIGVTYPTKFDASVDYNEPDVKTGKIAFFDTNNNRHADPDEIRLYDTGDGYEVECGSCHDPHGVKVENNNSNNIVPSFLRVGANTVSTSNTIPAATRSNVGSSLCLTCHVK